MDGSFISRIATAITLRSSPSRADGKLTPSSQTGTGGKYPRHFALDPTGKYLFAENQNSENIVQFRVDEKTGALTPTGVDLKISTPMCVVFVPAQ